jgi:hypothetical protein
MCWSEYITKARRLKICPEQYARRSGAERAISPDRDLNPRRPKSDAWGASSVKARVSPIKHPMHLSASQFHPCHFKLWIYATRTIHKRCKENPSNKENKWPTYCKCCLQSTWIYSQVELIIGSYDLICICVHIKQT